MRKAFWKKGIFRRWMKNEVGEVDEGETRREEEKGWLK
jgi:hypothetical protein